MASKRAPKPPEIPWGYYGDEVIEPGIGVGFVQWDKHGEAIRGTLGRRWRSRSMRSPAVTIDLIEPPTVAIYNSQDGEEPVLMTCVSGDKVNMSISYDLDRKLSENLEGEEVGVLYHGDQKTPKGTMRVFRVFTFGQGDLPF